MSEIICRAGLNIRISPLDPPFGRFNWTAIDDDGYDGAPDSKTRHQLGFGETKEKAIKHAYPVNARRS
jgi:hypothetical protein